MKIKHVIFFVIVLILIVSISACGQPVSTATPVAVEAPPTRIPTAQPTVVVDNVPPTETAIEVAAEPAIQHKILPIDFPVERSSRAEDYDSSVTADRKIVTSGDRFTFGWFERPFNANTMDVYFSQLDIIDTIVFQDGTWIYAKIKLHGADANNRLTGKYAVEIDLDLDGKGDWLIIVSNPASKEWSVNGVQIYQDTNKDVGSTTPMVTDGKAAGDGFETLVFDQENGSDPDSAWARVSSNDPNTVEIAIKRSVLGSPEKYLINMWAGSSLLNPALFDINDHFTHEQAGAADPGFDFFYPVKEVSELDNSCRMAIGFEPTGREPGLCPIFMPNGFAAGSSDGGSGGPGVIPVIPTDPPACRTCP